MLVEQTVVLHGVAQLDGGARFRDDNACHVSKVGHPFVSEDFLDKGPRLVRVLDGVGSGIDLVPASVPMYAPATRMDPPAAAYFRRASCIGAGKRPPVHYGGGALHVSGAREGTYLQRPEQSRHRDPVPAARPAHQDGKAGGLAFLQQQLEQAGLGVGVKLRFFDPNVSFGKVRPPGGLPEIEIRKDRAVRELVLEAFYDCVLSLRRKPSQEHMAKPKELLAWPEKNPKKLERLTGQCRPRSSRLVV